MKFKYIKNRVIRKVLGLKPGDMRSGFGKGKYVDVTKTLDSRILITAHKKDSYPYAPNGTIMLIPYQPNHGVMVEFIDENGRSKWRNHIDYQRFYMMFDNTELKK